MFYGSILFRVLEKILELNRKCKKIPTTSKSYVEFWGMLLYGSYLVENLCWFLCIIILNNFQLVRTSL